MELIEKQMDLFTLGQQYILAHCISADAGTNPKAMGLGIVVQFNKLYDTKTKITEAVSKMRKEELGKIEVGDCVINKYSDRVVCNLITKNVYYGKPTYDTLKKSLLNLKAFMIQNSYKYLGMPKIGCGLDKLQWEKVKLLINEVFGNTDIEIVVCCI